MFRFSSILICVLTANSVGAFAPQASRTARSSALQMSTDAENKDAIKVGVIGCGRIGIVHLGAINKAPGVVPVVVSNPTVSKAEDGNSYTRNDALIIIFDISHFMFISKYVSFYNYCNA